MKNIIYESRKGSFPKERSTNNSPLFWIKNIQIWSYGKKNLHLNEKKDSIHGAIKKLQSRSSRSLEEKVANEEKWSFFIVSLYLKNSFQMFLKIIIIFYVFLKPIKIQRSYQTVTCVDFLICHKTLELSISCSNYTILESSGIANKTFWCLPFAINFDKFCNYFIIHHMAWNFSLKY